MDQMTVKQESFYHQMFRLVLPIALQNLIGTAVNSADVIMLGYVSQTALSAASLANQLQFILTLIYSGIASGAAMLTAQYWGKKDTEAIEKIMGLAMRISILVSLLFTVSACMAPGIIMRIFTSDPDLIQAGSDYLRILGFSYLFMSISQIYLCTMRSIERVMFSTVVNGMALTLNICLNAVFIFGLFGAPKMGIAGVAVATVISRAVEVAFCLWDSIRFQTVRLRFSTLIKPNPVLLHDFFHYSLPALGNEVIWGVGFSMYSVIMGHLGSDVVAANSVVVVARNLGTVVCFGISSGGSILLGKAIGKNRMEEVKENASKLCRITFFSGLAGSILIFLLKPFISQMVSLTDISAGYLNTMLYINMYYILGQAMNTTVICGIFRSGGDARFGFLCDIIDMWLFAIPLGFLSAFVWKLPVMTVYFLICLDEFVKMPFIYFHYKSYRWLKNITRDTL